MAHLIENMFAQDRDASYADKFGTDTWHGLGTKIPHDKSMNVAETLAACAWPTTELRPNFHQNDAGEWVESTTREVVRKDNKQPLGSVGDRFHVWNPAESMKILSPWIESGAAVPHTGGTLDEGRILWLLLRISVDSAEVVPGDRVLPYLLYSQGTCGNLPHYLGLTIHRPVCCNTLMPALRSKKDSSLVRVKHTLHQGDALKLVAENIDLARRQMVATQEALRAMANKGANRADIDRYFRVVLDLPAEEELKTRAGNTLGRMFEILRDAPGQSEATGTVYAAYNAATYYLSHLASRNANNRVRSLWFGNDGGIAFDAAMKWVGASAIAA